jgi:hypothetical protein
VIHPLDDVQAEWQTLLEYTLAKEEIFPSMNGNCAPQSVKIVSVG